VPTVLRSQGYRLFFFSNEGSPREPVHVHIRKGSALAKFWLDPPIRVADSYGFASAELREVESIVRGAEGEIRRVWNEHFGE